MSGPLTSALKSGSKDLIKELNRRLAPAVAKSSVCARLMPFVVQYSTALLRWSHRCSYGLQDYIAERAQGTYVWTTDGQKHLDMACGEWDWLVCCTIPYPHPTPHGLT